MNILKSMHAILIFISLLFLMSCASNSPSNSTPQLPSWVLQQPVTPGFYIGIGSASRANDGYLETAQQNALSQISTQIMVNIKSDVVSSLIENNEGIAESYQSKLKSSTQADLEGYTLVDSWSDGQTQYVYYQLSKALYAEIQARKRSEAIVKSTGFINISQNELSKGNIAVSLHSLYQAFLPIIPYLGENLTSRFNGQNISVANEIIRLSQQALVDISLTPTQERFVLKLGSDSLQNITINASLNKKPLTNVPLIFTNIDQPETIFPPIMTNSDGIGTLAKNQIPVSLSDYTIQVQADLNAMIPELADDIFMNKVFGSFAKATTSFQVATVLPVINVRVKSNSTKALETIASARLQEALAEKGFRFSDDINKSDWVMKIEFNITDGSNYKNLYTAFADVSVNINQANTTSDKTVGAMSLTHIKGIDLDFEKARQKSLIAATDKAKSALLAQVMESLK